MKDTKYVLLSSAKNEEDFIEYPIASVISQEILPIKWVIVSDGSVDRTDEIILEYASKYKFIEYVRREEVNSRSGFASKVYAIRGACERIKGLDYHYIGHLDADISFQKNYFKEIFKKFDNNKILGIAGGIILERRGKQFKERQTNRENSVAGAVQCFRRECYEQIGGLIPIRFGGEDWIAEIMARMKGWKVESFNNCPVFHYKNGLKSRGLWNERFRLGLMDYSVGSHPLFEILKCSIRLSENPIIFGAICRFIGYLWGYYKRENRPVSKSFIEFLRKEQKQRIMLRK